MLASNATLVWLDISHNFPATQGRGAAWAASFAHALRTATALRTLKMRFNALCVEGGIEMAMALRTTRSLTLLDLRDNALLTPLGTFDVDKIDTGVDTRAVRALIAALRVNQSLGTPLATLRLDNNRLSTAAVARLRNAAPELKLTA